MKTILRCLLIVSCINGLIACQNAPSSQSGSSTASTTTSSTGSTNPISQFWSWLSQPSTKTQIQNVATQLAPEAGQLLTDYYTSGGNISSSQAGALGLQSAVSIIPTLSGSNATLDSAASDVAAAFAGDPGFKTPAQDLLKEAIAITGTSPKQLIVATSAAGVAVSKASQAVVASGSAGNP